MLFCFIIEVQPTKPVLWVWSGSKSLNFVFDGWLECQFEAKNWEWSTLNFAITKKRSIMRWMWQNFTIKYQMKLASNKNLFLFSLDHLVAHRLWEQWYVVWIPVGEKKFTIFLFNQSSLCSCYFQFNPYSSTHIMIWNSKQNIV